MIYAQNKNHLSNDVVIKGSIKFANEFIFDGNLEGDITSADGVLTVGENANVRGDVKSKIVIVKGKVHGNITVPERCELNAGSRRPPSTSGLPGEVLSRKHRKSGPQRINSRCFCDRTSKSRPAVKRRG